ncbi:hypothetical protein [Burkholderia latens]|uniref:hypothetical protein n=1 Tax=Burkholderia latens TaxID=488446 RepID=UPI003C7C2138
MLIDNSPFLGKAGVSLSGLRRQSGRRVLLQAFAEHDAKLATRATSARSTCSTRLSIRNPPQRRCVFPRDRIALSRYMRHRIFFGGFGVCLRTWAPTNLSTGCGDASLIIRGRSRFECGQRTLRGAEIDEQGVPGRISDF